MADGRLRIAITGTLAQPRRAVAERINSTTNGLFVEEISLQTHYLVAAVVTSNKAKKAAKFGTTIISESELERHLAAGVFPLTGLPTYRPYRANRFPDLQITRLQQPPKRVILTYRDSHGDLSIRHVIIEGWGNDPANPDREYVFAIDGEGEKTYRTDRIIEMEELA